MVLQTFIQNMLPKDGAAVYGKGMAGEMWKSMLAEKVARCVAERGGIGIADRMLGEHYAAEAKPAARNNRGQPSRRNRGMRRKPTASSASRPPSSTACSARCQSF